jgi:hypothetical protein
MNLVLWIAQALMALLFMVTGTLKLVVPREKLAPKMRWAADWPRERIKLLGLAEVAGAMGLVLPLATGLAPWLTPLAGLCLALLMAGAIRTHRQLREPFVPAVVCATVCVAIAVAALAST